MIPETVVRASSSFLAHLAEPAARALVLGCLAAIVLGAFRVKRVSLRIFAWTTVLYGALAIALVGWVLPSVPLRVPAVPALQAYAQKTKVVSSIRTVSAFVSLANNSQTPSTTQHRAARHESPARAANVKNEKGLNAANVSADTRAIPSPVALAVPPPQPRAIPWTVVIAGIYFTVAFLLFARLLLGLFLSHRLSRLSTAVADADTLRRLRFRAYASGLENVPHLAESELVSVPATLGVFRPLILLPVDWREWDAAKFDAILAHEVSHVARRDALTQRISLLHRAVFWFSPLSWWLDRKLNELAEEASDEAALGAGADQRRYAETLVSFFADLAAASGRVWWQGVSMASDGSRAGHAEQRLKRILAWKGTVKTGMQKSLAVALVAFAAPVIFLAASVHPVIAQDKTQSDGKNVVMPGGPKAPVLANAPKGGVVWAGPVTPAMPPAPAGGVVAPALAPSPQGGVTAPPMPPAPQGGVEGAIRVVPATPSAQPALMAVPGAPAHPPIIPGPIAGMKDTPAPEPALALARAAVALAHADASLAQSATPVAVGTYAPALAGPRGASQTGATPAAPVAPVARDSGSAPFSPMSAVRAGFGWQSSGKGKTNVTIIVGAPGENITLREHGNSCTVTGSEAGSVIISDGEDCMGSDDWGYLGVKGPVRLHLTDDSIRYERDGKVYVITDKDTIARVKAQLEPLRELEMKEESLGDEESKLGDQESALGDQMSEVKVKFSAEELAAQLEQVKASIKELSSGATQSELGRLQSEVGEIQSKIGELQSHAGEEQSKIGEQQSRIGEQQSKIGEEQSEIGNQEQEAAKQTARGIAKLLADAVASGVAKPQ